MLLSPHMSSSTDTPGSGTGNTHKLCSVCRDVLSGNRPRHDWTDSGLADAPAFSYDHHATGSDLLEAADSGCFLCIMLRDSIIESRGSRWLQASEQHATTTSPSQLSMAEYDGSPTVLRISYHLTADTADTADNEKSTNINWMERYEIVEVELSNVEGRAFISLNVPRHDRRVCWRI